jgi:AmmeMemoRadiSam system protein B
MATPGLRTPAVAGQFYPGSAAALRRDLDAYIPDAPRQDFFGGISPHAGYVYSGPTAGALFGRMRVPDAVVLLGPKHHGAGAEYAVWATGLWRTPLGDCPVNEKLAAAVLAACPLLRADETAHRPEHSLEVVVPFLQYVHPAVTIVPVALAPMSAGDVRATGEGLAAALRPLLPEAVVVVSSDMTHYESAAAAAAKDRLALDRVAALDEEGLLAVARANDISMCGVWPAAVGIAAVKALGAREGVLIHYTNSGEASGDYGHVVGYAAVAFA